MHLRSKVAVRYSLYSEDIHMNMLLEKTDQGGGGGFNIFINKTQQYKMRPDFTIVLKYVNIIFIKLR